MLMFSRKWLPIKKEVCFSRFPLQMATIHFLSGIIIIKHEKWLVVLENEALQF